MMEGPGHRLLKALKAAGFNTPTAAASAYPRQVNKNTLISHVNGNREISKKAAEKYGRLFGIDPGELLFKPTPKGATVGLTQVPVLSMVSASNLREQPAVTASDIERWIRVADLPQGDWIALSVDGDSMDKIAPNGATILINRADGRLLDAKFYVFAIESGAATFKQYRRRPDRLQPYSTNSDHYSIPASDDIYVIGRVRRVITDV